jgi:hypothetical protein
VMADQWRPLAIFEPEHAIFEVIDLNGRHNARLPGIF